MIQMQWIVGNGHLEHVFHVPLPLALFFTYIYIHMHMHIFHVQPECTQCTFLSRFSNVAMMRSEATLKTCAAKFFNVDVNGRKYLITKNVKNKCRKGNFKKYM